LIKESNRLVAEGIIFRVVHPCVRNHILKVYQHDILQTDEGHGFKKHDHRQAFR